MIQEGLPWLLQPGNQCSVAYLLYSKPRTTCHPVWRLQSLIDTRYTQGSLGTQGRHQGTPAEGRGEMPVSPAALAWRISKLQDPQRTKQSLCQSELSPHDRPRIPWALSPLIFPQIEMLHRKANGLPVPCCPASKVTVGILWVLGSVCLFPNHKSSVTLMQAQVWRSVHGACRNHSPEQRC